MLRVANSDLDTAPCRLQWESIVKWFRAGGGTVRAKAANFPAVQPNEDWLASGSYRGMMAAERIQSGQVVCAGPPSLIFSLARIPKGSETEEVFASFPASMEVSAFEKTQLWLIHEMGNPKSQWREYLCHIPRSYTFPLFWTDEQVREAERSGEGKLCYDVRFSNDERATLPVSMIHVTGEILAESTLDLHPGLRVTAMLLGESTQYQAWIVTNRTCPNSLRGLADVVKKRRNRLMARFNAIYPWLRDQHPGYLPDLSLRTFSWAYAAVVSRTWSIEGMP